MDIHKYLREGGNPDELEQHLMDLDSTFRFKCRRCGKCCKNQDTIIFTPRDIYNIAHKFGKSMEQVIALYYDQIYKFCYWKTHSAVDAQDITQDTFIRFMDAAQTYSDIESPKALLYTIAHHLCLNWLKKVPPDSLDELRWDQEPAAEDFADHAVQKIYLSTAIAALPNEQQEVLLLRYGQDLKVGEIAEILGLSRFQVMYRVRGALRQLKKLLKEESP